MNGKVRNWLIVSLVISGFISLFASSHPDGFEKAGEEAGYIEHASSFMKSPLPDYAIPGMDSWVSSSLAGLAGVAITFAVFLLLGKWIAGKK
ncbi:PDGLE domain-containing protein [Paenibacillus allorhizosphaerae]|uniref:PDGLE domain-containing protein n=1 Tax=Paenibacillus allorhizosphaerae TaxID=2849866 RepID=A0ABM8VC16_9BACL|nr:PDGLE domain-containing protein [Paenibacillus allorhizosphaerae]CAG7622619.1 hypothetical protein PAECIP111802_00849 [Paenibacillus allorhizosphaerae]